MISDQNRTHALQYHFKIETHFCVIDYSNRSMPQSRHQRCSHQYGLQVGCFHKHPWLISNLPKGMIICLRCGIVFITTFVLLNERHRTILVLRPTEVNVTYFCILYPFPTSRDWWHMSHMNRTAAALEMDKRGRWKKEWQKTGTKNTTTNPHAKICRVPREKKASKGIYWEISTQKSTRCSR